MGTGVLAVNRINIPPHLRTYAHCSKGKVSSGSYLFFRIYYCVRFQKKKNIYWLQTGITLLLINLSNQTNFKLNVRNILNINLRKTQHETSKKKTSFMNSLKTTVSWVGSKSTDENLSREEYHLTPQHRYIRSKTMLLNGVPLELTANGDVPSFRPTLVRVNSPISIAPWSIKFVQFPNFDAPGCKWCIFVCLYLKKHDGIYGVCSLVTICIFNSIKIDRKLQVWYSICVLEWSKFWVWIVKLDHHLLRFAFLIV